MMENGTLKLVPVYLAGLLIMAAAIWLLVPLVGNVHWLLVILGALLLCLGAVVCHVLSKRWMPLCVIGYFLNAVGSGCAVSALYSQLGWAAELPALLLAMLPAAVLGLVLCVGYLGKGKTWRKIWGLGTLLLALVLLVLAVAVWIKWSCVAGSMGVFSGICLLFFMMACLFSLDKPEGKWRYLSFSGFWAFAVIDVVVVLILSEGEILDGLNLDLSDIGGGKKKKARK